VKIATIVGGLLLLVASDARAAPPTYLDITFLMQNSESMMVAASPTDITALQSLTANASCWQTPDYNATTRRGSPMCVGSPSCTQGSVKIDMSGSSDTTGLQGCQCGYACHWSANASGPFGSEDYYDLARATGVQLRLDAVQAAVVSGINMVAKAATIPGQYGVTVMAFSNATARIWPPERDRDATGDMGNYAGAIAAVQAMKPLVTSDAADTNFPTAMGDVVNGAGRYPGRGEFPGAGFAGSGSNFERPAKALILITNGIQDWGRRTLVPAYSLWAGASSNPDGAEGPISAADCNAIKAHGYKVYVLYTTYFTSPATLMLDNTALIPYINGTTGTPYDLPTNLAACASGPNDLVQASDPADIQTGLETLVQAAMNGR
jgi:hypothetical protein